MNYQDINAKAIDRWIAGGWEWGVPVSREEYAAALGGRWDVLLTPTKPVPHGWFGSLRGKKLLGLASGRRAADADFYGPGRGVHRAGLFRKTA